MGFLRIDRLASATRPLMVDGRPSPLRRCHLADSAGARLIGLLGTSRLAADEAVWLAPCASVHTAFMRYPIGIAFLDPEGKVLRVIDALAPWRWAGVRGAAAVLEHSPSAARLAVGARLELDGLPG